MNQSNALKATSGQPAAFLEYLQIQLQKLQEAARQAQQEVEDDERSSLLLGQLLHETANALHGGPLKHGLWSFHDLPEIAKKLQEEKSGSPLKMYIWRGERNAYLVVTHAASVENARQLALQAAGKQGDNKNPIIAQAIDHINTNNPEIYYRENAEFVLTVNGKLEEQSMLIERLNNRNKGLNALLATLTIQSKQ